ncbi:MAG: aminoacyl-tRNA hydrolase [Candidatus Adiutricales bacterium]
MRLVAGLGNPGQKYLGTRHNLGFEVVKLFSERHGINLNQKRFLSLLGQGRIGGTKVFLLLPQTYMNLSGRAVRQIVDYFDLATRDILIVYDDMDVELGRIKITAQGSAGGHKGMVSIIEHLKTTEFNRIKIGIGRSDPRMSGESFVLSRFRPEEEKIIQHSVETAVDAVELVLGQGLAEAQERFNRKVLYTNSKEEVEV